MQHTMIFSTNKLGHIGQILTTALFGQLVSNSLTPPDPGQIEVYGHLVIQVLVAVVTIWATIRKALQKPESVLRVPVSTTITTTTAPAPTPAPTDADA